MSETRKPEERTIEITDEMCQRMRVALHRGTGIWIGWQPAARAALEAALADPEDV